MNRNVLDFAWPLLVLLAATGLIAYSEADLMVSSRFYIGGAWPVGELQPWWTLRVYGYYPCDLLGIVALLVLIAGCFKASLARYRMVAAYMVLLLLLGPGLLVNTVFKDHWGRPRPREIVQFGGKQSFHHPWQPGIAGKGRSFPSGHAGSAFYLAMPFFALRRRNPTLAIRIYLVGTLYGLLMGVARISQGGHYVSDILWAWGMVHLTAVALYYLMGLHREEVESAAAKA
jgi:membrane-associated PAP2 superfamily phosphatase